MNITRSITSWVCLYLVGPLFFATASVFVFFHVVEPQNLKSTVKESGAYDNVVKAVLQTTANTNVSTGQLPLKESWVQDAAKRAFPASDLEQKTNVVIDSTFDWLDGTTEQPTFTIDFSSNKARFGDEVGAYAKNRFDGLPPCALSNLPTTVDPFTINCRVPTSNSTATAASIAQDIKTDQNFLKNPVISPQNASLNPVNQEQGSNPYMQLEPLRSVYQHKTLLLITLPLLTVFAVLGGILLSRNRAASFKRLALSFLFSAISLAALGVLLGIGLGRAIDALAVDALTATVVGPIFAALGQQAQVVYYIFGGISAFLAVAAFAVSRFVQKNQRSDRSIL